MKKILILILTTLIAFEAAPVSAPARGVNKTKLSALVRQYRSCDGFDVVSLGSLGMGLLRLAAKSSADSAEDRQALKVLDHLNRVVIVSYEDADPELKNKFNKSLDKVLAGQETLMEAKSDGETVRVFGQLADDGDTLTDVVLHVPGSDALICLFGRMSSSQIGDAIALNQR